jgi:hypothetical protein
MPITAVGQVIKCKISLCSRSIKKIKTREERKIISKQKSIHVALPM